MELMLPFQTPSFPFRISYTDKILLMGSCFSEEIGNKLHSLKFNIFQNPNGILYDPLSIATALDRYVSGETFVADELFTLNGLWHSWEHHSSFSGTDKEIVVANINASVIRANNFLAEAKILIITLGTAFHYQLTDTKINVANCHKAPAAKFDKNLLTVNHVIESLQKSISNIRSFNPGIKIIFTISPVKHIRDGVIENNWSKARLLDAVHTMANELEQVYYFPSYELVNDILRDYRFL